jgi:hypothetical protein
MRRLFEPIAAHPATAPCDVRLRQQRTRHLLRFTRQKRSDKGAKVHAQLQIMHLKHKIKVSTLNKGRGCDTGQQRKHFGRGPHRVDVVMRFHQL